MSPNYWDFSGLIVKNKQKQFGWYQISCLFPTKAHLWMATASLQMLRHRDWRWSQGNRGQLDTLSRLCLTWPVYTFWCAAFLYLCMFKDTLRTLPLCLSIQTAWNAWRCNKEDTFVQTATGVSIHKTSLQGFQVISVHFTEYCDQQNGT